MNDPAVIFPDLSLFLTGWFRAALLARPEEVCQGVQVDIRESDAPRQLIINDIGGPDTSVVTAEHDVNLSVLAGTKEHPDDAIDLSRIVRALLRQIPSVEPGNPVAAVLRSSGPLPVPDTQPKARRLITVTFAIAGSLL